MSDHQDRLQYIRIHPWSELGIHPNWNELNLRVLMPLILRLRMEVSWTFLFNVKTSLDGPVLWNGLSESQSWIFIECWNGLSGSQLNIHWVSEWARQMPIEYSLSVSRCLTLSISNIPTYSLSLAIDRWWVVLILKVWSVEDPRMWGLWTEAFHKLTISQHCTHN